MVSSAIIERFVVEKTDDFNYILLSMGLAAICIPLIVNRVSEIDLKKQTAKFFNQSTEKMKDGITDGVVEGLKGPIMDIAAVGSEHVDHSKAFSIAEDVLKEYSKDGETAVVDIKLISVALCYSWDFIEKKFIPIAIQNKGIEYTWKIAIVDPGYLNKFEFDTKHYDWKKQSQEIIDKIKDMEKRLPAEGVNNVSFEVFLYKSIPQWHGLLIDRKHLFIGRTDWELTTESGYPRLTVGSNPYRYYNFSKGIGIFRIDLFRHWFSFYADFNKYYQD